MRIAKPDLNSPELIAPCGINCRLCRNYAREKNPCPGCRSTDNRYKSRHCVSCRIRNCERLAVGELRSCGDCGEFPCRLLLPLEKRYTTRYGVSPIGNLRSIKEVGMERFVESENAKWACPECGAMLCMHEPRCLSCGYMWRT